MESFNIKFTILKSGTNNGNNGACGNHADNLLSAIEGGEKEKLKSFIDNGADVNARGSLNDTALHLALTFNDLAFVEILVQSGADIELRDSKGKTPLQIAANYFPDSKEIMDYLIAKGADVNARDTNGLCILHVAASEGQKDLVEYMMHHKANVNARTDKGQTPFDFAVKHGNKDIVKLLDAENVELNEQTSLGETRLDEHLTDNAVKNGGRKTEDNTAHHSASEDSTQTIG